MAVDFTGMWRFAHRGPTEDFGKYRCAACAGMGEPFENEGGGSFTADLPRPLGVERPQDGLGIVLVGGQAPDEAMPDPVEGVHARAGTAGEHYIGGSSLDYSARFHQFGLSAVIALSFQMPLPQNAALSLCHLKKYNNT